MTGPGLLRASVVAFALVLLVPPLATPHGGAPFGAAGAFQVVTAGAVNNSSALGFEVGLDGASSRTVPWSLPLDADARLASASFDLLGKMSAPACSTLLGWGDDTRNFENFGLRLAGGHDFNGDGIDDIAATAPVAFGGGNASQGGRVDVFYGNAQRAWPQGANMSYTAVSVGRFLEGLCGCSVAAGEYTGDGIDDLVLGVGNQTIQLFAGSPSGLPAMPTATFQWTATLDKGWPGHMVGGVDLNGDGRDELLTGERLYQTPSGALGRVLVLWGAPGGLNLNNTTTVDEDATTEFGWAIETLPDTDGDGAGEFAVGVAQNASQEGSAYTYEGVVGTRQVERRWFNASAYRSSFGVAVAGGADLSGDGIADLAVGAPNNQSGRGAVYVFKGLGNATYADTPYLTLKGDQAAGEGFGGEIALFEDLDRDGASELAVAANGYANGDGRVYLFLMGRHDGLAQPAFETISPGDNSNMGLSMEDAGDIDGDGLQDLVVGLPLAHNGTNRPGAVRIYYGQAHPLPENVTVTVGGAVAWSKAGPLAGKDAAAPIGSALQAVVDAARQAGGTGPLTVPVSVRFEQGGLLNASNLSVVFSILRPPQQVSVAAAPAGGSLTVSWAAQVTDGTAFTVWSNKSGGAFEALATVPFSTTSYTDTNVTNGAAFYYYVTDDEPAVGTRSTPSSVAGGMPVDLVPPDPPSGAAAAVDASGHSVTLTWTAAGTDTTAFEVWRRVGPSGAFAAVRELPFPAGRYNDTGLLEDENYTYIVRAKDTAGLWSEFSAPATAHMPNLAPPFVEFWLPATWPDNLQLRVSSENVSDDDATWGGGVNGTFRWTVEGPSFLSPRELDARDLLLSPLLPGNYRLRLEAGDRSGLKANRSHNMTVVDRSPPTIVVAGSREYNEGDTVALNASGSLDSDPLTTLAFHWIATFAGGSRDSENATLTIAGVPSGLLTVILTVTDSALNKGSAVLTIAVNDVPKVTSNALEGYAGGTLVTIQLDIVDSDPADAMAFALLQGPPELAVSADGEITWFTGAADYGVYPIEVEVSDGHSNVRWQLLLNITRGANPNNKPPAFTSAPATGAVPGSGYAYNATARDPDGDTVTLALLEGPPGMNSERVPGGLRLTWLPPGATADDTVATVRLLASDGLATVEQVFFIRVRLANQAPTFALRALPETADMKEGAVQRFNWTAGVLFDGDDPSAASFSWSATTDDATVLEVSIVRGEHGDLELVVTGRGQGDATVTLTARDPSGASVSQTMEVRVTARPAPVESGISLGVVSLVLAGAVAAIVGTSAMRRRSEGGAPAPVPIAPPAAAAAAAPPAAAAASIAAVPAPGPPIGASYLVESAFLLYRDGRNMFWHQRPGPEAEDDPSYLGPMFVAIQDFVREALRKESDVKQLSYGENAILVERGQFVVLAVTVFGEPPPQLRETMASSVHAVEAAYAGIIEDWDGNRSRLPSVEAMLEPIWLSTAAATREEVILATRPHEVQVLSGLEFYQGYLRLKVAVVNSSLSVVTGATLDLDYDKDVLHLDRMEPETIAHEGAKVNLGVIHTGEKKTVAYYFDPLICTASAIDGTVRFREAAGAQKVAQMKRRQAEVVCPLFFTKELASTAVLKRLVESELHQYDVKTYKVAAEASQEQMEALYDTLKQAVLAHDIRLVREHLMSEGTVADAWFYGETKVSGDKFVVRAMLDLKEKKAEFYAASASLSKLTGLLAEMNRAFLTEAEHAHPGLVQAQSDRKARAAYADIATVWAMIERVSR